MMALKKFLDFSRFFFRTLYLSIHLIIYLSIYLLIYLFTYLFFISIYLIIYSCIFIFLDILTSSTIYLPFYFILFYVPSGGSYENICKRHIKDFMDGAEQYAR